MKTRKLLMLLVLTFAIVLFGFATTEVNAEAVTVIDEVNITGLVEPVEGGIITTDGIVAIPNVGTNAEIINNLSLHKLVGGNLESITGTYTEGDTIVIGLELTAYNGYSFDSNTKFKRNGNIIPESNITRGTATEITFTFTVQPLIYDVIDGNNLDTSDLNNVTFKIDADYSKFSSGGSVFVDNHQLTSTEFTSASGSTIITLAEDYAGSLSKGTQHILRVEFNDGGEATTPFTLRALAPSIPTTETFRIPFVKVVTGKNAPKQAFEFEAKYTLPELDLSNIGNISAPIGSGINLVIAEPLKITIPAITTNGDGSYDGVIIIEGTPADIERLKTVGFTVKEKDTGADNWTYSTTEYFVCWEQRPGDVEGKWVIYNTADKQNTDTPYSQATPVTKMTFTNTYINNPKTGDNIVIYSILFTSALVGMITFTVINRRKK